MYDEQSGTVWSVIRVGEFIQIKGFLFEVPRAEGSPLPVTLARLHSRVLGCRIGLDEDDELWLQHELHPHERTASAVGDVVGHMQAVADMTLDLLVAVVESGVPPTEQQIDAAFELNETGK